MEQIVVVQEAQTDKVSLMQIDNNGIQPDTLATAMLTDVNEAVTHQTEEEIVEEPFYVSWNYWQIAWIVYGSGVFILLVHLLVEMVRIWRLSVGELVLRMPMGFASYVTMRSFRRSRSTG